MLKDLHLKQLAQHYLNNITYIHIEYGCWAADPKRPFGNSDVEGDILRLLGIEEIEPYYSDSQREYAADLYRELGNYLRNIELN